MRITRFALPLLVLMVALVVAAPAYSESLTVSSYAMTNGGTGEFNYQDTTYLPCVASACDTTGAALSGGTGKLTDGISPALSWSQYGTLTPWVGWYSGDTGGADPKVTFNFANTVTVDSVTVWVDDANGYGGVGLPGSVSIDGTSHPIAPDDVNPDPRGYTFSGLDITGESVDVQFFQGTQP
jgi:hypothetical protein